jgi:hypothetical protein
MHWCWMSCVTTLIAWRIEPMVSTHKRQTDTKKPVHKPAFYL